MSLEDPGYAGGTVSQLAWECLGVPPEEVSEEREVWSSVLRLLPPRPGFRKAVDGWMDLVVGFN